MNTATTKSMNRGSTLIEEAMLRQSKFKDKFAEQKIKKFNPNLTQQISSGVSVEQSIETTKVGDRLDSSAFT